MLDPYLEWLGIPPEHRPPTHYQLLGISPEERDPRVIEEAALDRSAIVRIFQIAHPDECVRLLSEITRALDTLLDPVKRRQYDEQLAERARAALASRPPPQPRAQFTNSLGMPFVLIPAGSFLMGSPPTEADRGAGEVQHRVALRQQFYLSVFPVTVGVFRAFVRATRHRTAAEVDARGAWQWDATRLRLAREPSCTWENPGWPQRDGHPVVCVSWHDAEAFCAWLSRQEGREYRLPTEAEWEYACRAGTTTAFAAGASLSSRQANFNGNEPYGGVPRGPFLEQTTPVGSYPANAFGLRDMHGNVWEWCVDWYAADYYPESPESDPAGPPTGTRRVMRGGAWICPGYACRSAHRGQNAPQHGFNHLGFRVACAARNEGP
jgi:formylglycine-generating enzyme required for sulfatase activity